jgi:hypothetical protein
MTAGEPARGQPGPPDSAMPGNCLERVLGAGRSEAAARGEQRRQHQLIPADERGEEAAGNQQNRRHRSLGREHRFAPTQELRPEPIEARGVGLATGLDDQIPRRLPRLDVAAPDLPQPPPQTIAGHRGRLEFRDDESHPRLARLIVHPDHVQVLEAAAAAMGETAANVGRAREPMSSRKARRWRQDPPCFDGSDTVSRFRPFFRRRESTARPQRVAIRARNPCLLIRRLFRGLYDGFIRGVLPSEPGKLAGREGSGQVEGGEGGGDGEVFPEAELFSLLLRLFRPLRLLRPFSPVKPRLTFPHPARNISRP